MSTGTNRLAVDLRLPPTDAFNSELVQINVGPAENRRTFKVHEKILCHYSGYFGSALRRGFSESQTKHIELMTEDPEIFEIFVYWLYTRRLPTLSDNLDGSFHQITRLWVFADARKIPLLQNDSMTALVQTAIDHKWVPTGEIKYIYENTMPASQMRRVLIDLVSKTLRRNVLDKPDTWTKEALLDLAGVLWAGREVGNATTVLEAFQASYYHVPEKSGKDG